MTDTDGDDPRRRIPRTDALLASPPLVEAARCLGVPRVKDAVVAAQEAARRGEIPPEAVADRALAELAVGPTTLRPLINATGVVLHTNIGRAPLSTAARSALLTAAGYVDVEYDISTGSRATRGRGTLAALARAVPAAQDVHVVNNGAAALVLAATTLAVATGRPEIVLSRGEMVEIGDGFRLHELLASTGATIVEIGTTNRTRPEDYAAAITPHTGLVLKVHPSNFRITGFTSEVPIADVRVAAGPVPVLADIGSGLLRPHPLLPGEPDAASALLAGADLVTCSGDKLLGGPQAGLILGRADLVAGLRTHPLARALRVDKLTLAALEATLLAPTPTCAAVGARMADLHARTSALAQTLTAAGLSATARESVAAVGGGGAPGIVLDSVACAVPESLATALRHEGVITRVEKGACLLDLRCVPPEDDERVAAAVLLAAGLRRDDDVAGRLCD